MPKRAMKTRREFEQCAEKLRAVADPGRLRIIQALRARPKNVTQLAEELGQEVPNVSHHLSVLRHCGMVTKTKRGRFTEYRLHPKVSAEPSDPIDLGCCRLELPKT
jgi:DNA-binding transcriptional ArsR family regulator